MGLFKKNLAGPGYVILNALRVLNIISLLAACTAAIVMLVKTFMVSKFFFFDGLSHVFTFCFSAFLIISETGLFRRYFELNFPLLSIVHGLTFLGSMMAVIGVHILGNLNKEATSQKSLGKSFWQIVISSGILVSIIGVFNIVASYVFHTKSATARMVRAYGAVADQKAADSAPATCYAGSSVYSPTIRSNTVRSHSSERGPPHYREPEMRRSETTSTTAGLNISSLFHHDPTQFSSFKESGDIRKPDLAAHPALTGQHF